MTSPLCTVPQKCHWKTLPLWNLLNRLPSEILYINPYKEALRITLHQRLNINSILPPLKLKIEFHLIPKGLFSSATRPDWSHFLWTLSMEVPVPPPFDSLSHYPGWMWWMGIPCGSAHQGCSWWRLTVWPLEILTSKLLTAQVSPEKAMAPHSSPLAWKIPWTEEPRGLQSRGSRRVGHDWSDLAAAAAGFLPSLPDIPQ